MSAMPAVPQPEYNPFRTPVSNQRGSIDAPSRGIGGVPNIVWQTRSHAPTAYEFALCAALEAAYEAGADSPQAFADYLNKAKVADEAGAAWTAQNFVAAMNKLGA
jgi:hypothetical protein